MMLLAVLLATSCAHVQPDEAKERANLVSIELKDVALSDAVRMFSKFTNHWGFTKDSLTEAEMSQIRVTVSVEDVDARQAFREMLASVGLEGDIYFDKLLRRVARPKHKEDITANKLPVDTAPKVADPQP